MRNQYKSALVFSKIVPKLASLKHWNNLEKTASNDLFDLTHIPQYFEICVLMLFIIATNRQKYRMI